MIFLQSSKSNLDQNHNSRDAGTSGVRSCFRCDFKRGPGSRLKHPGRDCEPQQLFRSPPTFDAATSAKLLAPNREKGGSGGAAPPLAEGLGELGDPPLGLGAGEGIEGARGRAHTDRRGPGVGCPDGPVSPVEAESRSRVAVLRGGGLGAARPRPHPMTAMRRR